MRSQSEPIVVLKASYKAAYGGQTRRFYQNTGLIVVKNPDEHSHDSQTELLNMSLILTSYHIWAERRRLSTEIKSRQWVSCHFLLFRRRVRHFRSENPMACPNVTQTCRVHPSNSPVTPIFSLQPCAHASFLLLRGTVDSKNGIRQPTSEAGRCCKWELVDPTENIINQWSVHHL